jgi:hypothetical protein
MFLTSRDSASCTFHQRVFCVVILNGKHVGHEQVSVRGLYGLLHFNVIDFGAIRLRKVSLSCM